METVVEVEGNDEAIFDDIIVDNLCSTGSLPGEIADPIVYQLVRVDGDGRLVPATDDEVVVMEVEDLLDDDKIEDLPVADSRLNVECSPSGRYENSAVDAKPSNFQLDAGADLGTSNAHSQILLTKPEDSQDDQSGSGGESSNLSDGLMLYRGSISSSTDNMKPDFSKLEGEICLNNLSVRELQETFKATFGRETSVKDKQWLKRRIAMALSNSCIVSTMTFMINDNKVVKKGKQESLKRTSGTLEVLVTGAVNESEGGLSTGCNNQTERPRHVPTGSLTSPRLYNDNSNEDLSAGEGAGKRVRKPTRRYIEELSDLECREESGKFASVKNSEHEWSSSRSRVRPVGEVHSDGRPVVTRLDSFGGSGVQVPYVCRVRRSRPRENFMSLMKLQPNTWGSVADLEKKAAGSRGSPPDNEIDAQVFNAGPAFGCSRKLVTAESEKDEIYLERKMPMLETDIELKDLDLSGGDNEDDYGGAMPPTNGGMRRKHHRPWTLSEVVKLVGGVAKYGAGKWSEIKRFCFAAYPYRTSVDLKDKWRNLLRASLAQPSAEKAMQNSRKQVSAPIPEAILVRVRELADMQSQSPSMIKPPKFVSLNKNVQTAAAAAPGFL